MTLFPGIVRSLRAHSMTVLPVGGIACLLLGPAVVGPASWAPVASAQPGGPVKVSVVPAEERVFHPMVEALGRIEAVKDTEVSAEVPGLIAGVVVDEGDRVEAGEVLARQDVSLREIRKRQAEAEVALANEQLREFRAGSRPEDIREARASLADAVAQLEEARLDRQRVEALEGTDAVSDDEISSARAIERSREAIRDQRQATLDRLVEGPRAEVIARAEAQLAIARARLDEIVDEIAKATIRAPFGGVITEKRIEAGRYVREGDALFGLVQTDPVRAVLSLSEEELGGVAVGQVARIRTAAGARGGREGKIVAIIPRGDPASRTFPVKVRLDNADGRLLPGMSVRGTVATTTPRGLLAVPTDALAESPVGTVVFVVRDGKAVRVPVTTGVSEEGWIAIEATIQPGEPVVVLGNETLRPESDVTIVPRVIGEPAAGSGGSGEGSGGSGEGSGGSGEGGRP